jgi:Peroxiredoxin
VVGRQLGRAFFASEGLYAVCTTELGAAAKLKPEFEKRNTKIIGLSVDPLESHVGWEKDIEETQGCAVNFPMIADPDRKSPTSTG